MKSERLQRREDESKSNLCATIGFLLTLLNITVSIVLWVTKNDMTLLIFASVTALISLIICICGLTNSKVSGRGKALSIIGIILNVLILLAVIAVLFILLLFVQACAGMFQGLTPN